MATLEPIRIGDTLIRSYAFYAPVADTYPAVADTDEPIDLTGVTVSFHIKNGSTLRSYAEGDGVTVTPLTGLVEIELETEDTSLLKPDLKAETYLKFVYPGGNVKTKAHQREMIIRQEDAA